MTEEKNVSKPMQLWNSAVKVVKGENTAQLVEQFTAEMTLVAEGLCEDQAKLRRAAEELRTAQEQSEQRLDSRMEALDTALRENQRETDRRLDEMARRLNALESRQAAKEARGRESKRRDAGLIRQLTVLVSIVAGAWVLVTILNLFK